MFQCQGTRRIRQAEHSGDRKQRKQKGPEAAARLPSVTPLLRLKLERIKDYFLMGKEFVANQEGDQLEPGCAILMHNKVLSVVGLLQDEVDPMVSVMKVEKTHLESYADIGGLDAQLQEIEEAVELPLTHPELYKDIDIKPPKGVILYREAAQPGTGKTLLAKPQSDE